MPLAPKRPCRVPLCPALVDGGGYCPKHAASDNRDKAPRPSRQSRGYSSHYVNKYRPWYLRQHPMCESIHGCNAESVEVHHVQRLADDGSACDPDNCQALCSFHHSKLGGQGGRG